MNYVIKMRSITSAQRAVKLLNQRGISSTVGRVAQPQKGDGCGYTVKVSTTQIRSLCDYLEANGIHPVGVEQQ